MNNLSDYYFIVVNLISKINLFGFRNYNQLRDNKTTVENNLLLKQADNRTLSKCLYGLQSQNSVIIEYVVLFKLYYLN